MYTDARGQYESAQLDRYEYDTSQWPSDLISNSVPTLTLGIHPTQIYLIPLPPVSSPSLVRRSLTIQPDSSISFLTYTSHLSGYIVFQHHV